MAQRDATVALNCSTVMDKHNKNVPGDGAAAHGLGKPVAVWQWKSSNVYGAAAAASLASHPFQSISSARRQRWRQERRQLRQSDGAAAAANNNQTAAGNGSAIVAALEAAGKRNSISVGSSGTAMAMAVAQQQRGKRQ